MPEKSLWMMMIAMLISVAPAMVSARGQEDDLPFRVLQEVFRGTPVGDAMDQFPRGDRERDNDDRRGSRRENRRYNRLHDGDGWQDGRDGRYTGSGDDWHNVTGGRNQSSNDNDRRSSDGDVDWRSLTGSRYQSGANWDNRRNRSWDGNDRNDGDRPGRRNRAEDGVRDGRRDGLGLGDGRNRDRDGLGQRGGRNRDSEGGNGRRRQPYQD